MQAGFKKGVKLFKHLANKQLKGVEVIGVFEWIFSGPVIGLLSQNNAPHCTSLVNNWAPTPTNIPFSQYKVLDAH